MNPNEALQYLSQVASDYTRSLPPSAQGPTVQAINQSLATLAPLAEEASRPRALEVTAELPDGVKSIRPTPGQPAP